MRDISCVHLAFFFFIKPYFIVLDMLLLLLKGSALKFHEDSCGEKIQKDSSEGDPWELLEVVSHVK
jgi:hypothetical protein